MNPKRRFSRERPCVTLLSGLLLLVLSASALAHGVDHRIRYGKAVIVQFSSDHAGPMVDVGYRVFTPDGRSVFARGRTDARGRAVFVPDGPGTWRMMMAGEDGHGTEVEIAVAADSELLSAAGAPEMTFRQAGSGGWPGLAAGVGYVFGLGGLLLLLRRRARCTSRTD